MSILGSLSMTCHMGKGISSLSTRISMLVCLTKGERKDRELTTLAKELFSVVFGWTIRKLKENLCYSMGISLKAVSERIRGSKGCTTTRMETYTTGLGRMISNRGGASWSSAMGRCTKESSIKV